MAKRWSTLEEYAYRKELSELYEKRNFSIKEIGAHLGIKEQTVFYRIRRLGIISNPSRKAKYCNRRTDVVIPKKYSEELAELFGIMLGDGHVSHFQSVVTLGTKEAPYAEYVRKLFAKVFRAKAKISIRADGYRDVYLGSTEVAEWFKKHGLVSHKVRSQVSPPKWIFSNKTFLRGFIRGMFDTDGSIYRLRFGLQISFTNYSVPLLGALQSALIKLQYKPSSISGPRLYVTRRSEIKRFLKEIKPRNPKHIRRLKQFLKELET